MAAVSKAELRRRISGLRHLASAGRDGCAAVEGDGVWELASRTTTKRFPAHMAMGWLAAGLAQRLPQQRIVLTSAGRAHLKRAVHELEASPVESEGTPSVHAAQHRDLARTDVTMPDATRQSVLANLSESPLGWLYRRKATNGRPLLSDVQFQAGERLRSDHDRGRLRQRVSANWEAALAGGKRGAARGGDDLTDAAMDARARVDRALGSLIPDHAGLVQDVCCHLKSMAQVERERAWPRSTGRIVLAMALEELAKHYGMIAAAPSHRQSRTRVWHSANGDG